VSDVGQHFWLSFADRQSEGSDRFLGVVIVAAADGDQAVTRSHELGLNPGGEVLMMGPFDYDHTSPFVERLLSATEARWVQEPPGDKEFT
jgi:hypothetical protein